MLEQEFFEYFVDRHGRKQPALKSAVPARLLRVMGLMTGESDGSEEEVQETRIPVRDLRDVRERCSFIADFAMVAESEQFPAPMQLVTIPCRSTYGAGRCMRKEEEHPCTLFGVMASVETPDRGRLKLIVAPVLPGTDLSPFDLEWLLEKREAALRSSGLWEEVFTPIHMLMDFTTQGMQFWLRSWFGK